MNLQGKTVAITGANRGIGWALVQEISKRKSSIAMIVRKKESVSPEMIQELKEKGAPEVYVFEQDLSHAESLEGLVEEIFKSCTPHVLINNAGLLTGGLLEEQDAKEIQKMIQVNVVAVSLLSQYFLRKFLEQGEGKIVNNASVMGEMRFPASSTYAASKAYVIGLTESLKKELRETNVNTLLMYTPGVKTDMFDDIHNKYEKHIDLDFLSSIPAEDWAKKVVQAIEKDHEEVKPTGATGFGLILNRHFPRAFEALVATKFHRS